MGKMTEDERQKLHENFDTYWLLSAVDQLDKVRGYLAGPDGWKPPEIRSDLLKLHQMAMDVVNKGWTDQAREFFELANDLEDQFLDMADSLESIQETLYKLTALYPESLFYDDDDDEPEVQAA